MTPISLAIISAIVFVIGIVVIIWNMATFWKAGDLKQAGDRIVVHFTAGTAAGAGAIGLIASLIWYIVLACK